MYVVYVLNGVYGVVCVMYVSVIKGVLYTCGMLWHMCNVYSLCLYVVCIMCVVYMLW